MKKVIFVSTGRCGTKRIFEILRGKSENISVRHQMSVSRLANVLGNLIYFLGTGEQVKKKLYCSILKRHARRNCFVCTDPLVAMIIPESMIRDKDTMIIHITRPGKEFARSFFKISRTRVKSFIAHNFIPFWQINVYPLENLMNKRILQKYESVCAMKNQYFQKQYAQNPNYRQVNMSEVFSGSFLETTINDFLGEAICISREELAKKSN